MSRAVAEQEQAGTKVVRQFEITPPGPSTRISYDLNSVPLNLDFEKLAGRYLTHWTRATNTPWPDERPIDFYHAILESARYPRSGFDTLCHIIETRIIKASSRHMPENIPTVSFTGLSPREVIPLMRWRARYTQMSFEPYGLAVPIELADTSGICPVLYRDKVSPIGLQTPVWLTQSIGTKSDWRQENEYRHLGDFALSDFAPDRLLAFCLSPNEAQTIEGRYGIQAMPLATD